MDEKIINIIFNRKPACIDDCVSLLDKEYSCFETKEEYDEYLKTVTNHFNETVGNAYPLLKLINRDMKCSYVVGYNIPACNYYDTKPRELEYGNYGMFVLGFVTWRRKDNFYVCQLFDVTNTINYEYLKTKEYCHLDSKFSLPFKHICTHKERDINKNNFISTPVNVSLRLYLEYKHVDSGGTFRLDCYEHGGRP